MLMVLDLFRLQLQLIKCQLLTFTSFNCRKIIEQISCKEHRMITIASHYCSYTTDIVLMHLIPQVPSFNLLLRTSGCNILAQSFLSSPQFLISLCNKGQSPCHFKKVKQWDAATEQGRLAIKLKWNPLCVAGEPHDRKGWVFRAHKPST